MPTHTSVHKKQGLPHFYIAILILIVIFTISLYKTLHLKSNIPLCERCNIILIVADPLRTDELPCYGYLVNTAPNLCTFADRNIRFTNAYSQSSWTLPSIMSLFSSLYPSQHNVFAPDIDVLPAQVTTLPMALHNAGYTTVFIGPIDDSSHHVPLDKGLGRGFDSVFAYTNFSDASEQVMKFMSESSLKKPVFVFIHSFDLRNNSSKSSPSIFPLDPTYSYGYVDPYLANIRLQTEDSAANITSLKRAYDERIRQLDEQIHILLQATQNQLFSKRTIIAFTSDHGEEFGEHGQSTHGVNLFATTTHIPLIISIPNTKATVNTNLVQSIDIYPTLLSIVGLPSPKSVKGIPAIPKGKYTNTALLSQLEPEKHLVGIRTHTWSYYFNPSQNTEKQGALYDLLSDPKEIKNIAKGNEAIIEQLLNLYRQAVTL